MNEEQKRIIEDCKDEIASIKKWVDKNLMDSNVKYLVAYSVVKASGTIEIVFKSMLYEFLSEGCKKETQLFLTKNTVDLSCNPSVGMMEQLLEKIDTNRKNAFSDLAKVMNEKADLNSLVSLRNDIAHGRNINVSIATVKRYYESGVKIIKLLERVLK